MGVVWKARDLRLERIVALKVLRGALTSDPVLFAQFQREARGLALVQHPAIVTVFSVEQAGRIPFFTMEFVEGTPLSRYVPASGLPLAEFYQCAIPLAEATGAAHAHGILHRDLKPSHIMVTAGGVKVLDFGLAAVFRDERAGGADSVTASDTWAGDVRGTPPFMSPEQVLGRTLDPHCLERSVANGVAQKGWFAHDSNLDCLRALPRFSRLMASLNGAALQ